MHAIEGGTIKKGTTQGTGHLTQEVKGVAEMGYAPKESGQAEQRKGVTAVPTSKRTACESAGPSPLSAVDG